MNGNKVRILKNSYRKIKVTFYEINRNGSEGSGMVPGYALIDNRKIIHGLIFLEIIFYFFPIFFFKRKGTENETIKNFEFFPAESP